MRRAPFLAGVAALTFLASTAAYAATPYGARVAGSRTVELGKGRGFAVLGSRGAALGNLSGRIEVIDVPGGGSPQGYVRGCERRTGKFSGRLTCRGAGLRFLVYGGTWRIRLSGNRINVSGRIRGRLGLDRADRGTGWFEIGSSERHRWPATLTFYVVRS